MQTQDGTGMGASGNIQVRVSYYGPKTSPVQALIYITGVELSLSADVTRTGRVKPAQAGKDQSTWTWGPGGRGAILLVNCDKEDPQASGMDFEDDKILDNKDLQDMSPMTLSTKTPKDFFEKYQLVLEVPKAKMNRVRVFRATRGKLPSRYKVALGPQQFSYCLELPGGQHSTDFYVEGLAFPDADFKGLIPLTISLLDKSNPELPEALVFQDSVTFRVAPWIMTPNTQPPQEVYVCRVSDNEDFLKSLATLTKKAKCKLTVCPEEENIDDQWMQGPNFGYVTRKLYMSELTGLDAFGNLEGFRLLLSSPRACYQLFQELQSQGHGEATLFEGLKRKRQTINEILSNKKLRDQNAYVESCIDWNRAVLKRELGLAEGDIIDIPQLFKLAGNSRGNSKAQAFFPNMVNMLVLGKYLGIPKPFGPIIDGHCCLEEEVRSHLEPLGLHCTFINDFYTYHVYNGEVHCGTNVRRKPFTFKWWHMVP